MFAMQKMLFITSIESGFVAGKLKYSLHKVIAKVSEYKHVTYLPYRIFVEESLDFHIS